HYDAPGAATRSIALPVASAPPAETRLGRDKLLRRRVDRAAPCLGLRPPGSAAVHRGDRLRRRSMDVLQVSPGRSPPALPSGRAGTSHLAAAGDTCRGASPPRTAGACGSGFLLPSRYRRDGLSA